MPIARILGLATLVGTLGLTAGAQAQSFAQTHPRHAEVNGRLANQNARITAGVKDGQLTHGEARAMRADDHAIRAEERTLNRQENANSRVIHDGRHP